METKDKVKTIVELLKGETYSNIIIVLEYVKREIENTLTLK